MHVFKTWHLHIDILLKLLHCIPDGFYLRTHYLDIVLDFGGSLWSIHKSLPQAEVQTQSKVN